MLPGGIQTPDPVGKNKKSRRSARLSETVRELVSQVILYKLKNPKIGFITVLGAEVTEDLKEAKISISVMGSAAQTQATLEAIEHSKGYIQYLLGKRLRTRNTPVLTFKLDESLKKASDIEELFDRIKKEREGKNSLNSDPAAEGTEE